MYNENGVIPGRSGELSRDALHVSRSPSVESSGVLIHEYI